MIQIKSKYLIPIVIMMSFNYSIAQIDVINKNVINDSIKLYLIEVLYYL